MLVLLYLLGAVAVIGVAMFLVAGINRLSALRSIQFRATFKSDEREDEWREERPRRRLNARRNGRADDS